MMPSEARARGLRATSTPHHPTPPLGTPASAAPGHAELSGRLSHGRRRKCRALATAAGKVARGLSGYHATRPIGYAR